MRCCGYHVRSCKSTSCETSSRELFLKLVWKYHETVGKAADWHGLQCHCAHRIVHSPKDDYMACCCWRVENLHLELGKADFGITWVVRILLLLSGTATSAM